jgi:4-methyl-5(b-hydroxyethyl)-thiazole monophosphate biosynthesis
MVYLFLADGFEDMEAIVPFDLMKRAGIEVVTVGIGGKTVESAHGLSVTAEISEEKVDFDNAEAFVFPGGWPGAKNLKNSETVNNARTFALHNDIIIGAICASPGYVLSKTGALSGKKYTCFPGFEENLTGAEVVEDFVVADGNIITGKGAGASLMFGAAIVDYFKEGAGKKLLKQVQHI